MDRIGDMKRGRSIKWILSSVVFIVCFVWIVELEVMLGFVLKDFNGIYFSCEVLFIF